MVIVRFMLDQTELIRAVEAFREKIEPCWTDVTAYKVPEIQKYGPYISGGQCAVTCLLLWDVLQDTFLHEKIVLVSGQVLSNDEDVLIRDHGWLRMGSGSECLIIDPTADQAASIQQKVVIGTAEELERRGLRYIEKGVEVNHGEAEHPKRFKRYQVLKDAWVSRK